MKQTITSVVAMLLAVLYSVGLITAAPGHAAAPADENKPSYGISTEYENRLFDTGTVHTVEIQMDTGAWNDLKDNALYKEYHDCNVTIDGETFYHVGVRTKGNTTLHRRAGCGAKISYRATEKTACEVQAGRKVIKNKGMVSRHN